MRLLVIGGGPAGAAAAIVARRANVEVTILEASHSPREKPGETLHPGIEPLLDRLGAGDLLRNADYLRHAGTWVEWGGPQQFVPFGSDDRGLWRGFQAPRADLDERLLTLARGLGAEVLRGRTARAVILRDGRVVGVDTGRGELYAQYTVDASGSTHWLARQMKIPIETHSPKLAARFGYFETAPADGDRLPRIRADETGWTWIADIGLERYLWTRVSEQELPEDWAPRDWGGSTGKSRGADVTWRRAIRPAGPGWFLAGDSAAVLDPSSSHGVLKAVMSGMLAAYYAAAMLRGEARADQVSEVYSHWLEAWFRHDVSHLANSYRLAGLFGF